MRRIAMVLTALLLMPAFTQTAKAATSAVQSGRSGSARSGARTFTPGIPRTGIPRTAMPRGQFPRPGNPRRGFVRHGFIGGVGTGVFIGVPLLEPIDPFWPGYDTYAYPYGLPEYAAPYPPEVYAAPQPYLPPATVDAPSRSERASQQIWYYCQDPMGYYPYIQNCNSDWQTVPASVLPSPSPLQ